MSNVLEILGKRQKQNFFVLLVYQNCIKENAHFLQNLYNLTDFYICFVLHVGLKYYVGVKMNCIVTSCGLQLTIVKKNIFKVFLCTRLMFLCLFVTHWMSSFFSISREYTNKEKSYKKKSKNTDEQDTDKNIFIIINHGS